MTNTKTHIGEITVSRPGLLIVFEGLDGAGKSTQVKRLASHLEEKGYSVEVTTWNSSKHISRAIRRAKKAHLLTPSCFSALHAADFLNRLENIIIPSLNEGKIVIADRYSFTGLTRDQARGVDIEWVKGIYSLAIEPDIAILCDLPVEIALNRSMKKNGDVPKYYECGMDVSGETDPTRSFREFQGKVNNTYQRLVEGGELVPVCMSRDEEEIFASIIEMVEPFLDNLDESSKTKSFPIRSQLGQKTICHDKLENCPRLGLIGHLPYHSFPGKLIAIEGCDRETITHQVNALYDWFQIRNIEVTKTGVEESWITSEIIIPATAKGAITPIKKVMLSLSEMAYIMDTEVIPALERGGIVILNDSFYSIFKDCMTSNMGSNWLVETMKGFAFRPDAAVLIDCPENSDTELSLLYRSLAEADGITILPESEDPSELYTPITEIVSGAIGIDPKAKGVDKELREVLELYHKHNGYFEHAQKVRQFAVQIFDSTVDIHGLNSRARRLLEYAALLHDVGRSMGDDHEKHSYRIIMDNKFSRLSDREKRIMAICALYHNGSEKSLDNPRQWKLRAEEQFAVRKLAGILRLADALDASDNQVIMKLRLVRERGFIILDLNAVNSAKAERKSVLNKKDLFESEFGLSVLVDRNRVERIKTKGDKAKSGLMI